MSNTDYSYDSLCKSWLIRTDVIANTLKLLLPEYKDLSIEEIKKCLDFDSKDSEHIKELNTEDIR